MTNQKKISENFVRQIFNTLKNHYKFYKKYSKIHWSRVVMNQDIENYVCSLNCKKLTTLEIDGKRWSTSDFASYTHVKYPKFDVCKDILSYDKFDIIIIEQVLEHTADPLKAIENIYKMLKPDGILIVNTPFLIKIHNCPIDCSRWTELGLKNLLNKGGFELQKIKTKSWGNKKCVIANMKEWKKWIPFLHSLKNNPEFPIVVWSYAKK